VELTSEDTDYKIWFSRADINTPNFLPAIAACTMSKNFVDDGLKSFAEVIKQRFARCGVRITRKMIDHKYESIHVRFPVPDKNKNPYANVRAWHSEHSARMEIVSTDSGYTYSISLNTSARVLELANPGVFAELEGICDAIYKLAKRDQHWPKPSPAPPIT